MTVKNPTKSAAPDITVLIAAYNAAGFIERAIDSALCQIGPSIEVLVVDDASTDSTREDVAALAERDARVRLLSLPRNGGPSVARNAGIEAARGKWIAVLDADDAFGAGRLARLLSFARVTGADIISDNFVFHNVHCNENSPPALHLKDNELASLDCETFVSRARPYATEADYGLLKPMLRREFLVSNEIRYQTSIRHGEDFMLIYNALLQGACYRLCGTVGYIYTTRDSGRSRTLVDYDSQIRVAIQLAAVPEMIDRPRLRRLLRQRARALRRLSAHRLVSMTWQAKDYKNLAWLALTRVSVAREVLRKIKAKLV